MFSAAQLAVVSADNQRRTVVVNSPTIETPIVVSSLFAVWCATRPAVMNALEALLTASGFSQDTPISDVTGGRFKSSLAIGELLANRLSLPEPTTVQAALMTPVERRNVVQVALQQARPESNICPSEAAATVIAVAGMEHLLGYDDRETTAYLRQQVADAGLDSEVMVDVSSINDVEFLRSRFAPMEFSLGSSTVQLYGGRKSAVAMLPRRLDLGGYSSAMGLALLTRHCATTTPLDGLSVRGGLLTDLPHLGWSAFPPPWRGVVGWMGSSFGMHNPDLGLSVGVIFNRLGFRTRIADS